ncbi:MAG: hypothetical protein GY757_40685 [bacterium]|nr:hypothetical protein [bacterium]
MKTNSSSQFSIEFESLTGTMEIHMGYTVMHRIRQTFSLKTNKTQQRRSPHGFKTNQP